MLTILGDRDRRQFCDGHSRRDFLKIGGLALGGLSLTDILRAETRPGAKRTHKAIIMVYLAGGPAHLDMFDLKPNAPAEIRGDFKPISTKVPGIQIGETFPKIAALMDKFVIVRSLYGARDEHAPHHCFSGFSMAEGMAKKKPSIGAVLSKVYGPVDKAVPPFVGLCQKTQHFPWSNSGEAGFLGMPHAPVKTEGPMMTDMTLNGISLNRLADRRTLLASLDRYRRTIETPSIVDGLDSVQQRAFDVLTSNKLVQALDLSKEDPKIRARYGDGKPYQYQYDGAPTTNDHLLIARRLVEAGVRCVTLSFGRWDSHSKNSDLVRDHGGKLDQCLSALVEDLHQRGMLDDTLVVTWGEFGRTPRINKEGGRDHWPQSNFCLLAGGGLKTGQVVGSTDETGSYPKDRPVHFQEIFATLYHALGLDVENVTVPDAEDRPNFLVDGQHRALAELV